MTRWHEQQHLFFIVLEHGKAEINLPVDSVLGEHLLSALQTAVFSLCPPPKRDSQRTGRKASSLVSLLMRALILS